MRVYCVGFGFIVYSREIVRLNLHVYLYKLGPQHEL